MSDSRDNQNLQHVEDVYSSLDVAMMYLVHEYGTDTIVTWLHDNCYQDTLNMITMLNMCDMCGEHADY